MNFNFYLKFYICMYIIHVYIRSENLHGPINRWRIYTTIQKKKKLFSEPGPYEVLFRIFRLLKINPLNPELNPICYLLALLAHHLLHVSRLRVKSLTLRLLMSYIYIYIYIYIYMERLFLMFLDHTQRRSTVGRTPLDE